MKRHGIDWQGRDLFEDPAGGWVEYGDAQAVIEGLQRLLNERDDQVGQLGQVLGEVLVAAGMIRGDAVLSGPQLLQFGREFCENLSKPTAPVDFNAEVVLPAPSDPTWAVPVRLTFDGAEGEGRLWLSIDPEHDDDQPSIAVEGCENARILARLLLAWAGDK